MDEYSDLVKAAKQASAEDQIWRLQNYCLGIIAKIPDTSPDRAKEAVGLFAALRRGRRHEQLQMLGEAFIKAGYQTPRLWTIYAQALIERGSPVAARGVLNMLLAANSEEATEELKETYGLCGRAWKDIAYEAIKAGRKDVAAQALKESHQFYVLGYNLNRENPELVAWCGSQRVALSHFAMVNGIVGVVPDETALAQTAVEAVEKAIAGPGISVQVLAWLLLGCAELRVALGDLEGAIGLTMRAIDLGKDNVDSFMLGSLHRQVSQIWQIGSTDAGAKLEALLTNAIVERQGGVVLTRNATAQLQARMPGEQPTMPLTSIRKMLRQVYRDDPREYAALGHRVRGRRSEALPADGRQGGAYQCARRL